jgi:hypothetical protein
LDARIDNNITQRSAEGKMSCCLEFDQAFEDGLIKRVAAQQITDGPMMNQIVSEYYLGKPRQGGYNYYAFNYCPFCGMPRSLVKQGLAE